MTNREKFIRDVETNGRTMTLDQYAEFYGFRDGKQASDYLRYFDRTGKYEPESSGVQDLLTTDDIRRIPEGFIPTKVWEGGKDGALKFSYAPAPKHCAETIEEQREQLIEDLKAFSPKVEEYPRPEEQGILYEISLPDMHFGKGPIEDTITNFKKAVYDLINRVEHMNVERILLPLGNDILNSEGLQRSTTRGTPQFDSDDWRETFRACWTTCVEVILALSKTAPVDILLIQGNHDFERSFYLGDVIAAYFHNNENVNVNNSFETRKYYQWGVNLIGFDHGELKQDQYPLLMATEKPMAFAQTKHHEWHLGHWHKEMMNEFRGIKVRFVPSMCPADYWHKKMGYAAKRKGQAYKWSKKYGMIGYEEVTPWI